jgi:hypothetical protein
MRTLGSAPPVMATAYPVGPDYLKVLGLRITAGRALEPADHSRATVVAIVNQNLADVLWPGRSAVGETMLFGPERQSVEVIGVVANAFVGGFNPERPDPKPNFVFVPQQVAPGDSTASRSARGQATPSEPVAWRGHALRASWRRCGDRGAAASGLLFAKSIGDSPSCRRTRWTSNSSG